MKEENCLKIFSLLLTYLQEKPNVLMFSEICKKFIELVEKSELGTVETEVSLNMTNEDFIGQFMLHNWMEVSNYFGSIASFCFHDFGHVALETNQLENGMATTIYFQPEKYPKEEI